MTEKGESEEHRKIKLWLSASFRNKGWTIEHIDGEGEQTESVENNNNIGDGKNKRPDIDANDKEKGRLIRGEAKVDNGDFDSEHSITQYKLFSNRSLNGVDSWLIIGVPEGTKEKMEKVLSDNLSNKSLGNIAVLEYRW